MFIEPIAKAFSLESLPPASIAAYVRIKEWESSNTAAKIPTHTEYQPHEYALAWTVRRDHPPDAGGHFYIGSYGIHIQAAANSLVVWRPACNIKMKITCRPDFFANNANDNTSLNQVNYCTVSHNGQPRKAVRT